jgi:putative membrane protein
MHRYLTVGLVALALGLLVVPRVQAGKGTTKADPNAEFVKKAIQRGTAEVAFGQLSVQRAGSPQVRQLAQRIVDDHIKADNELMDLARTESFEAPEELDPEHRAMKARLSGLTGAAFDHEYLETISKDYVRYVALLREYAQHGTNTALTAWAARTVVMLRRHQQLASVTAREIKPPSP